jgi:hypothetical protein
MFAQNAGEACPRKKGSSGRQAADRSPWVTKITKSGLACRRARTFWKTFEKALDRMRQSTASHNTIPAIIGNPRAFCLLRHRDPRRQGLAVRGGHEVGVQRPVSR